MGETLRVPHPSAGCQRLYVVKCHIVSKSLFFISDSVNIITKKSQILNLTTISSDSICEQMQAIPQPIEQGIGTETDSVRKSVMKTISWRVIATAATFLISWVVTGSVLVGGVIASVEFWAKLVLYYLHERAWSRNH